MSKAKLPEPIGVRLRRLAGLGVALGSIVGIPSAAEMLFAEPASAVAAEASLGQAITRSPDGLFHANVSVNGNQLACVVDTGATDFTFSARAAYALGIRDDSRRTAGSIATAGGSVRADRLTLDEVGFAGRRFADVPAVVVRGSGAPCLIGQGLLARLSSVELRSGRLYLR